MRIEFARGDDYQQGFIIKDKATGNAIIEPFDEVYFSVKKRYTDKDVKLQKRMTEGGIVDDGLGHYTLYILPGDTDDLAFGDYDFDIEFTRGDDLKRTFTGTLTLLREVTHSRNEVTEDAG